MTRRLAIAFEFPTLSGGERSMLALLGERPPAGWEVVAIAPPVGPLADALSNLGIPIEPLDLRAGGNKPPPDWTAAMLGEVVDRVEPTVLHANSLSMSRVTGRLTRSRHQIVTGHIRDMMKLSGAARDDLNRNRILICVSGATRAYHVERGLREDACLVVHNGVRREASSRPDGWLRDELGVDAATCLIGTVGQICLRKGHDVAAAALRQLALRQLTDRDWRWLVIGQRFSLKAESATYEDAIVESFTRDGLGDRVVRLGYRTDMADLYSELDFILHPARQEPFGRVLLEAGAYGKPLVATDVGGTREIVGDDFPLVPVDDVDALAAHLRAAMDDRQRYRFSGDRVWADRFSVERCYEQTWSLWNRVSC